MISSIKSALPWWAKIGVKLTLSRMPMAYGFWQRLGLFRHGSMDTASYALDVFDAHVLRAGIQGKLNGMTLLEIGPGDSVATAIIASAYGAKAVLVDSGPYASEKMQPYHMLIELLQRRGLSTPDLSNALNIADILEATGGRYLTKGLSSWRSLQSASVDFVFSQAVLEHVRRHEFLETQRQCLRVMKSGAIASHRVDLRDHLGGSLNNLRFSERLWESDFFVRSGFYTNRIQCSEMLAMFKESEFLVTPLEIRRWPNLPTPRAKLSSEFADLPDEELRVSGFDVLLSRPLQD